MTKLYRLYCVCTGGYSAVTFATSNTQHWNIFIIMLSYYEITINMNPAACEA